MNVTSARTSTTAVSCSVATLSESLSNDNEKPNQPKRLLFPKCNYGCKISMKHAFSLEVVFINLYWKDGCSGKTGGFCKRKLSSLYNQAIEVIAKKQP